MAGIVNKPIKWTPKDKPTINEIKISHLLLLGLSISCSQRSPSQNKMDIIKVAIAYTSVSTALNQKESVNANAKLPTSPLPKIAIYCCLFKKVSGLLLFTPSFLFELEKLTNFLRSMVIVQNIKTIVKALDTALIIFIIQPFCKGSIAKIEKNAPII